MRNGEQADNNQRESFSLAQQKPGVQDSVYLLAVADFMVRQSLSVA